MKSKIEKTEWKCPACGTTRITPWYVKELEPELEGIYPEIVKKIIEKVGKMLNDNSQDQEEEKIEIPEAYIKYAEERKRIDTDMYKSIVDSVIEEMDTPEEKRTLEQIREEFDKERVREWDKTAMETYKQATEDTPEEWVCPKCGFDDCYPYKNSEDFGLDYCPICSKLVKLTTK